jgi:Na+/H+ antiporter
MDLATQLLLCLTVVAVCAGIVRWVRLPLPVLQTLAGAILAWPIGVHFELDPHAFLLVLIPPLLYIDGWRIPKSDLRANRATILMMAFGLVVITVLLVGVLADYLVPGVPLPVAFAIAAALSPTDAVAVSGITGRVAVPRRLMIILQGEALFNDASGLVAMRVAVAAMLTGAFSWGHAAGSFVIVAVGGVAVGVAMAWLLTRFSRLVFGREEGDTAPRILLLLLFPYAAYLAAEEFELSGILAAVAAGMVAVRFSSIEAEHRSTRLQMIVVTHMFEGALNGLVFVLLGLQLPTIVRELDAIAIDAQLSPTGLIIAIAAVIGGLAAVRFIWVWVSLSLTLHRAHVGRRPPLRLVAATTLAGVRGAVTLAAALTLPLTLVDGSKFPAREVAIFVCAVVIVVWLIVASIGLPLLLRNVELPDDDGDVIEKRVRGAMAEAAIEALQTQPESSERAQVIELYRARLRPDQPGLERELRRVAIAAERKALHAMSDIDVENRRRFLVELDLIDEALDR